MTAQTSIWKKEITLRRKPKPVERAPLRAVAPLSVPVPVDAEFRKLSVLEQLVEESAFFSPQKADGWRASVSQLRTFAEDGLLPVDFDPVVRTLVHELLRPRIEVAAKPQLALPAPKLVEPEAAPARTPSPAKPPKAPKAVKPPKPPKEPKAKNPTPLFKREVHLPSLKLPSRAKQADATKLVGLRIGSSQLAAALVNNNGSAELLQLARSPLERGIVSGGEVRDPEALAAALKRFFAHNKLPRHDVRLGVATNRIGVRVLEVPAAADERTFANAVRFRAQDIVPIPLADAVLDHVVIGETPGDRDTTLRRVLLVFAHRELVDGYLDACKRAGIKLAGIDFDAFALLRALSPESEQVAKDAAVVAVAIGHERTVFAVSEGAVCDFARVLDWGGASLDDALARALDIEPEEAEAHKQALSLEGEPEAWTLSRVQLEAARTAVKEELQVLVRELVSSLQFYQSRSGSLDIGEVLLAGGGAQLDGLAAELGRQLGIPVRTGDPMQRVKLGKGVEPPQSTGSLAIAVGLGIEA